MITRCSCEKCVQMCRTRPCLPTPEEAARLDPARTMRVRFGELLVTSPAMVGREGREVSCDESGACVFLKDDLCELHAKGLKPLEGKLAHHSIPWRVPREYVLSQWAGARVVIL